MSTSISDYTAFKQACLTADLNTFKQHPDIVPIFEHTSAEQGEAYLQVIRERYPLLLAALPRLVVNDEIGGANRCITLKDGPSVSPSTLRYVKVLGDLIYAGLASGDAIVEIGGGYGGQALVIRNKILWQSYTIFDLPEAGSLQERYLAEHDLTVEHGELFVGSRVTNWDFCISNYAFSECNKQMQDWYLEHVILKSKKGYMTCNFISSQFGVDSYSQEQLLSLIPYSWLEAENPLTSPANVVIRW
jgi:hypothetical protein